MAKRPTLTDVTSLTNSSAINTLNQNWDSIQEAFDNTLSRDGSTPNTMNADLDLNGNALLNVGTIDTTNLTLDGQTITDIASVPEWRGAWVTSTSYTKNDLVKTAGNVYICLISHTSSAAFSTDLTALRWELMVSKGDSGAGTGDLLSTNNLSDVANPATARSNLGLGSLSTLSSITTTQIAAATLVTESEGIASNDNDTTIPTSAAVDAHISVKLNATGSAPLFGVRAWVNFNGTGTVAIRQSGNVSSITDNGVGDYTINFTTAMPDENYAVSITCTNELNVQHAVPFIVSQTASSVRVSFYNAANSSQAADKLIVNVMVVR